MVFPHNGCTRKWKNIKVQVYIIILLYKSVCKEKDEKSPIDHETLLFIVKWDYVSEYFNKYFFKEKNIYI